MAGSKRKDAAAGTRDGKRTSAAATGSTAGTGAATKSAPGKSMRPRALSRTSPIEDRAPEIIRRLTRAYPDAKIQLRASNPLEMLVATILSAQSTDRRVNIVTETLFRKYEHAEDYLRVPESELKDDIHSTGFFNQKAKAIRGAALRIVEVYDGAVPDTMEELITLPGVARKTANIVLGNSFGSVQGIAVDTHVRRLAQRLGFSSEQDPDKIERDLMRLVPRDRWFEFTYVLIEHGREICTARSPNCAECPVNDLCPSSRV
jgi:endonuclease-3